MKTAGGMSVNYIYIRSMDRLSPGKGLLAAVSAVLFVLALGLVQFYLAWICLVPLFMVQHGLKGKRSFFLGLLFGFVFGVLALYWVPLAVADLSPAATGKSILTGILVFSIVALYYGLLCLGFSWLKSKKSALWTHALLMAALWTVGEFVLSVVFSSMPWFSVSIGNTLLGNLYVMQLAAFGGIHLLNFIVVLVNYLFAHYLLTRQWHRLAIPLAMILVYLGAGCGILYAFKQNSEISGKPVTVALLSGNIPQEETWNEANGNRMVADLLDLNRLALAARPDIVLWPESVVPWTYRPDDDLVQEILRETRLYGNAWHIIGLNTFLSANRLYNSAYCLQPDGRVAARHDKHYLVSMAEQPVTLFSLPILPEPGSYIYCEPGKEGTVAASPGGKAGLLICSEVYIPAPARAAVQNGAEFLVSLSNNDLFGSALGAVNQHFFRNRLRAVETRKDIAVSCNMGISGMFRATGELIARYPPDGGFTHPVVLQPNRNAPVPGFYSVLVLCLAFSILLIFFFLTFKNNRN